MYEAVLKVWSDFCLVSCSKLTIRFAYKWKLRWTTRKAVHPPAITSKLDTVSRCSVVKGKHGTPVSVGKTVTSTAVFPSKVCVWGGGGGVCSGRGSPFLNIVCISLLECLHHSGKLVWMCTLCVSVCACENEWLRGCCLCMCIYLSTPVKQNGCKL